MSSSALAVGIVGLPNVGKSTLFNALLKKSLAEVSNYPFCTIEPNLGIVPVPDKRLEKLAKILKPKEIIPVVVEFIDLAGLVKNAHQGEGLGNEFLGKIREVAAILHVVRAFEDKTIAHVQDRIDPVSDVKTVQTELALADLETVRKCLQKLESQAHGKKIGDKVFEQIKFYQEVEGLLNQGVYQGPSLVENTNQSEWLYDLHLLSFKPQIMILNIAEKDLEKLDKQENDIRRLQNQILNFLPQTPVIALSAKLEADLTSLSEIEQREYREGLGFKTSGLEELIKASYQLLDLVIFYTTRNQILQAWSLKKSSRALEAASLVHTDFAKGFIKVEVIPFDKFVAAGSWEKAKEKGFMKLEGKDYLVQEGDLLYFHVKT